MRPLAALATALTFFAASTPVSAYLKFGVQVGDRTVVLKWDAAPRVLRHRGVRAGRQRN